jgi:hypothetical protein
VEQQKFGIAPGGCGWAEALGCLRDGLLQGKRQGRTVSAVRIEEGARFSIRGLGIALPSGGGPGIGCNVSCSLPSVGNSWGCYTLDNA